MRRVLSILLLLLFGLGPLTATLEASDDAGLPACCRRHGAHHCAMMAMMARQRHDSAPGFSAPSTCPCYPGSAATLVAPISALAAAPAELPALHAHAFEHIAVPTHVSSCPGRTHAGRGPPASI